VWIIKLARNHPNIYPLIHVISSFLYPIKKKNKEIKIIIILW